MSLFSSKEFVNHERKDNSGITDKARFILLLLLSPVVNTIHFKLCDMINRAMPLTLGPGGPRGP